MKYWTRLIWKHTRETLESVLAYIILFTIIILTAITISWGFIEHTFIATSIGVVIIIAIGVYKEHNEL